MMGPSLCWKTAAGSMGQGQVFRKSPSLPCVEGRSRGSRGWTADLAAACKDKCRASKIVSPALA